MQTQSSFSIYLREELDRRKAANPGYSLRAFAKSLSVSSSFLSKVMNAKKSVSEENLLRIATRLKMSEEQLQSFTVQLPKFKLEKSDFNLLAVDQFQYIADWHHFAILEASTLSDFKPDAAWLAKRFTISKEKAELGLQRLIRMGLLEVSASGKILGPAKNHTSINGQAPQSANREHERQILYKAIEALDEVPIEYRSQSSMTMAIPRSRIKEAKERIKEFRRELNDLLQRKGKRDSVYQLSVSFFPLTNELEEDNKNKRNNNQEKKK